ncbi:MAG: DUF5946 family protein [Acidobacteriaceae bacterium]|nr:DUF5946 family protein [Acidobacteriaceae bacterium]
MAVTYSSEPCPRCGISYSAVEIMPPTTVLASQGCWGGFNQILANEYSDPARMAIHHLTVDAYMAQHPGDIRDRFTLSAFNSHLLALYFNREFGVGQVELRKIRAEIAAKSAQHGAWLSPPASLLGISFESLLAAENSDEHRAAVVVWADCIWHCWEPRKMELAKLAAAYGLER